MTATILYHWPARERPSIRRHPRVQRSQVAATGRVNHPLYEGIEQ